MDSTRLRCPTRGIGAEPGSYSKPAIIWQDFSSSFFFTFERDYFKLVFAPVLQFCVQKSFA